MIVKKDDVYIATKPLQYINCTNIKKNKDNSLCIICDQFCDSNQFYNTIKRIHKYSKYKYMKSKNRALWYVFFHQYKIKSLYLDSDFGLWVRFILLFLFNINICVYEEGYASYLPLRNDKTTRNRILLKISSFFKIENYNGGGCRTNSIYLYDHHTFRQNLNQWNNTKLKKFVSSFEDAICKSDELKILYKNIDFDKYKNQKVIIYLSSWTVSSDALTIIQKTDSHNIRILKLHPHIKMNMSKIYYSFDYILPANLPFEYFYFNIVNIVSHLTIIHHGTFAVKFIKFGDRVSQVIV